MTPKRKVVGDDICRTISKDIEVEIKNSTITKLTGNNGIYNKLLDKMMINLKNDWLQVI